MQKKMSKKKINFSHLAFQISSIFIFIVLALVLCSFVLFKTHNIKISTSEQYETDDIINVLNLEYGENVMFLKVKQMEETIFRRFPYLENINVVKSLPSTVSVTFSDAKVCYSVKYKGNYVYVSKTGKLLELASFPESESIIVSLGEISDNDGFLEIEDKDIGMVFEEIMKLYSDDKLENISEINLSDKYNLQMVYDDRITFDLGAISDLNFKIQVGMQVMNSGEIAESESGTLNLSLGRETSKVYFMSDALLHAYDILDDKDQDIVAGNG